MLMILIRAFDIRLFDAALPLTLIVTLAVFFGRVRATAAGSGCSQACGCGPQAGPGGSRSGGRAGGGCSSGPRRRGAADTARPIR